jgi:Flp pilus assembly pilin Flp
MLGTNEASGPTRPAQQGETKMRSLIVRFLKEEDGMELVEWALVGGIVVAVTAAAIKGIGTAVKTKLTNIQTELNAN